MADPYIPAADLPLVTPGEFDTIVGVDEATRSARRFPIPPVGVTPAELSASGGGALVGVAQTGVGAVHRTVLSKMGDFVTSADFGAYTDGTTATSARLQAAIDRAAGGKLTILPGTYLLDATLRVPSNTTIDATGATFYRAGSLNCLLHNDADGTTGESSANTRITILGGTWDSTSGTGNCTVMAFGHARGVKVQGAKFINENQWHHLELNGSTDVTVQDCWFVGGFATAYFNNEAIQIDSADLAGQFPWFGPYDNSRCRDIKVINNRFDDIGCGIGTHSATTPDNHNRILIEGNTFSNVYGACVRAFDWSDVKINNNKGTNIAVGVLRSVGSRMGNDITITNNTFYYIGYGAWLVSRGIQIEGDATRYCKNLVISGNKVLDVMGTNGTHGITADLPRSATISNNIVDGANRSGVFVYGGQDVEVSGNIVTGADADAFGYQAIRLGNGTMADSARINVQGNICDKIGTYAIDYSVIKNNIVKTSIFTDGNGASTFISGNVVAGVEDSTDLSGSAVYDPPPLAAGIGITTAVTVTGAAVGDYVTGCSFSAITPGVMISGSVTSANVVSVRFRNDTGTATDMPSGTIRVKVKKA